MNIGPAPTDSALYAVEQTQTVVVTDEDIERLRLLLKNFLGEEPLALVTFSDGYIRSYDIGKLCELENSKPQIRSLSLTSRDDEATGEINFSNAEDDNITIRLSLLRRFWTTRRVLSAA